MSAFAAMGDAGGMMVEHAAGNSPDLFSVVSLGACAVGAAVHAWAAKPYFELRSRLEASVKAYGYNDRVFGVTTEEWCTRQTAIGVAESAGRLGVYEQLCEKNKSSSHFTDFPHWKAGASAPQQDTVPFEQLALESNEES